MKNNSIIHKKYTNKELGKARLFFLKNHDKYTEYLNNIEDINEYIGAFKKNKNIFFWEISNMINNEIKGHALSVDTMNYIDFKEVSFNTFCALKFVTALQVGNYEFNHIHKLKIEDTKEVQFYIQIAKELIERNLDLLGVDKLTGSIQNEKYQEYSLLKDDNPIRYYIQSNPNLTYLNKNRSRNIVLFDNDSHQMVYDLYLKRTVLTPKIPFSDFEHDTNRKYTEEVIKDFLYNFENNRMRYMRLLKRDSKLYSDQIHILTGEKEPTREDLIVLISLLGRLSQQDRWGPISTFREQKLNPELIKKHETNKYYIEQTIYTLESYRKQLSFKDSKLTQIPKADFDLPYKKNIVDQGPSILLLSNVTGSMPIVKLNNISTNKVQGDITSPNYLESFFRKITGLKKFENVLPYFNSNEDLSSLVSFSKRYRGTSKEHDFIISYKMRSILDTYTARDLAAAIKEVYTKSRINTYSLKVADYLIKQKDRKIKALYELYFIFYTHIENEKHNYLKMNEQYSDSIYNDSYLAIASDMHFNNLISFEKSNYSSNFNIIAGDFADNLYHRGNALLEGIMEINGVGVLGNHDVYLRQKATSDLECEINSNYERSIIKLKESFPNIRILNDEIIYRDGYAIVGLTLFYDIHNDVRTFFANEHWGKLFESDDYLKRAKSLLDQVPKNTPIIFISHSPFKEYAVCTNTEIGVPSNYIFKDYSNVKIYIHGHGHSKMSKRNIEGILCITNPIVLNSSLSEVSFSGDEIQTILGNEVRKKNGYLLVNGKQ